MLKSGKLSEHSVTFKFKYFSLKSNLKHFSALMSDRWIPAMMQNSEKLIRKFGKQ